jgi:hypothetical protein
MRPLICLLVLATCALTASDAQAALFPNLDGRRIQRAKQGVGKVIKAPFKAVKQVGGCR